MSDRITVDKATYERLKELQLILILAVLKSDMELVLTPSEVGRIIELLEDDGVL